ncbi:hypothetical protein CC86DRAFT_448494 [Ophiobolus disseminans]|uniref:Uncharacterized protein n=1 Tax=Ophiobolus disseminans TaxID=1469910 RepID=A0A6A6ZME9_9PLEO|nr:hypothetical protein CC86DRAFT_448494 [Ophiobolus disseminans]
MNWTGGTLQRTKNANKGVVQRQKAHFARVRTYLQNGSNTSIAPFRPSYLQNDDSFELAGHLPSFGSGSVRHTGHSARHHRDTPDQGLPPDCEARDSGRPAKVHYEYISPEASHRPGLTAKSLKRSPEYQQQEKRRADETDSEFQLLEANRKRLLRQNDWIGVTPSRAVNLNFLSRLEKSKIGRRREVDGKHGATTRRGDPSGFATQRAHPTDDQYTGPLEQGAMQANATGIRVRIGTDALTTACSTQAVGRNLSHASSDAMLFDQPASGVERQDMLEIARERPDDAAYSGKSVNDRQPTWADEQARGGPRHLCRLEASNHSCEPDLHGPRNQQRVIASAEGVPEGTSRDRSTPSFRITQQVEGVEHPLRLVFVTPTSDPNIRSHHTLQSDGNGVDTAHAGMSETGSKHHLGNGPDIGFESEAKSASAIVDERPWKSLFDIPENSSSHTTTSKTSGKSMVHHHFTARRREAESTRWSQHATQGNDTLSSSLVSASLPSLKQGSQTRVPAHVLGTDLQHRNKVAVGKVNEEEKQWEDFIFGSDKRSSSETSIEHRESSVHRTWKDSSGYLPLSAAVSSLRSTPFRATSGRAPRMSDRVHDAARPRTISSPAAMSAGFIEELSDEEQGNDTAELNAFGEQFVTHASLHNNASGETDLISSRMFSDTVTSRSGLDPPGDGTDSLLGHVNASNSQPARKTKRPSSWDIPDSDEGRLHLVDRDSFD